VVCILYCFAFLPHIDDFTFTAHEQKRRRINVSATPDFKRKHDVLYQSLWHTIVRFVRTSKPRPGLLCFVGTPWIFRRCKSY